MSPVRAPSARASRAASASAPTDSASTRVDGWLIAPRQHTGNRSDDYWQRNFDMFWTAIDEDFALAASLPPVAAIPPRAMVVQAGGAEAGGCRIRIVRYVSAAPREDVLQYHFTRARRAGLKPERYAAPEAIIAGKGKDGTTLVVHVRAGVHGLTAVDLLYKAMSR